MVRRAAESSVWLALVGAVGMLATSAVCFGWGLAEAVSLTRHLFDEGASSKVAVIMVLETIDVYLIAVVLLIFAIGLVELFITDLNLPDWLIIDNLDQLKSKLIDVVVLVAAIKFLEKLLQTERPIDALWYGLSVAAVGGMLIVARVVTKR